MSKIDDFVEDENFNFFLIRVQYLIAHSKAAVAQFNR
jgi:hypothetical protein